MMQHMYEQYETVCLRIKCAFVAVVYDYFSQGTRNKQCQNPQVRCHEPPVVC